MIIASALSVMLASGAAHAPAKSKSEPKQQAKPLASAEELQWRPNEPFRFVREFLAENDLLTQARRVASAPRRDIQRITGERLLAASAQDWSLRRNKIAAVAYALSGGHPVVIKTLVQKGYLKDLDSSLVEGAVAYAEGRLDDARKALASVDAFEYPGTLAAPLFLIKGVLLFGTSDADAMSALDSARLLAPGSLVEESALRRQAVIALRTGDLMHSVGFFAKWMRRFPNSSFAADFLNRYLEALAGETKLSGPAIVDALATRSGEFPREAYVKFLVELSSAGLQKRRLDVALNAARAAKALAGEGSAELRRANLYEYASLAASPRAAEALARLQELDASSHLPADRAVLAAAISIASQLARLNPAGDTFGKETSLSEVKDRAVRLVSEAGKTIQEAK